MAKELQCWKQYPEFLTVTQAQELLNVGRATIYRWIEMGKLPGAIQIGDTWRISREMLKRYVEGHMTRAPTKPHTNSKNTSPELVHENM